MRISKWLALSTAMAVVACSGSNGRDGTNGSAGANGADAPTTGTITGTVTDAVAQDALAGVTVTVKKTDGTVLQSATTDAFGKYSATAPLGTVAVGFAKANYTSPADLLVGVIGGGSVTANAALSEAASGKPSVSLTGATDVGYGATTTVTASGSDPNGDTLTYTWSNGTVPALGSVAGSGATATVTLPTMTAAFASRLESPTAPNQYISGYAIPDRFGVLPILPDTRGEMSVTVTVSDGRGQSVSKSLTVDAASVLTGSQNVAMGTRVYLNSGHDGTNAWTLTVPTGTGSTAALDDTAARTPSFVADKKGKYTVAEGTHTMDIYVGDWQGIITGGSGNSITVDSNCIACHDDNIAPDEITPWLGTGHATMFTRGINGGNGSSYGPSCIVCHTVGNDKGVANGGFDDVAATAGWSMPAPAAGNWDAMVASVPQVAKLANIQCENCHGPQNSTAHRKTQDANLVSHPWSSPRIRYSAELCATCHASGTGHHNYSEWSQLDPNTGWGHSNRAAPVNLGLSSGALNPHCGRCHTAQGYSGYSDQLASGNPGNLVSTQTAEVTAANVEPVTCTACHDPHDATNPNQLRAYGDTPLLAAGFKMSGVGKGALCMTCHNSRNATYTDPVTKLYLGTYLHEDGETYNSGNPTGYSAPHQACQTDVFAGRNAYFLGATTPMTSRHAAIEDACVGCHMAKNPQTHLSHGSPAVSGHVFFITDEGRATLCANCHGTGVTGEGIAGQVEAGLANLGVKMGNAVEAKMNGSANGVTVVAYDSTSDHYSASAGFKIDTGLNPVTAVTVEEIHGQIGFNVTFTNAVTVQLVDSSGNPFGAPQSMTSFGVQMGSLKDGAASPQALFALSGNMVRAGWNYFLIEGDQSKGIHNPTFATTVLDNTLAKDLSN